MGSEIVVSGTCVVSRKRDASFQAYLGSCVGVTLVDRETGVGGMLHLLLPEPSGTDVPFRREIYATTGMPRFLERFFEAGASKEKTTGCIAGGALVGQVSESDLWMDIGGRTAELVQRYLEEHGIAIEQGETGGYVGRKMRLDLNSGRTVIEPIWQMDGDLQWASAEGEVFDVEKAIEKVKPIPQVALKIIRMIQEKDYAMEEVGREIRQDQVISGKVLNLCNSAIMGFREEIDSIDRAVVVLGEKRLLKLVISASVESLYPQSTQGYSLCKGGIFQHALGTALISQEIAVFSGKAAPDIAYTAGLLHDIGKIPLDQFMAVSVPYFYRKIQEEGCDLCKTEKARFGIDHTEAGRLLGTRWDLPKDLINVIVCHHFPELTEKDEELVSLVYLADLLMSKFQVGYELDRIDAEKLPERLMRVGLIPDQFPVLVDRIPRSIFQLASAGAHSAEWDS